MFVRDTKALYRQSFLGYLWILLPPLATAAIWIFLSDQRLVTTDTGGVPVSVFVLTGTILWTAFNLSVVGMQAILSDAKSVLSKVNFPHEALVISGIGKAVLNTIVPAFVLIPILPILGVSFTSTMLLFPIGLATLILLGCAIGLLLVPLAALYSDIGRIIQLALRFGFFITPVIYALPASGTARTLLLLNPVSAPLITARAWLLGGESMSMVLFVILILSTLVLFVATIIFKITMPHIIERLNA